MTAAAAGERIAGELVVSGKGPSVRINGESAQSGRAIFSTSTVSTPDDASAVLNLGKIGTIQLGPNTTATISFDNDGISGELVNGTVTVLGSAKDVNIKTPEGDSLKLHAGESAASGQGKRPTQPKSGVNPAIYIAIAAAVILGVVAATALGGGGGSSSVSPTT